MPSEVNTKRSYDSRRRRKQAESTRRTIREAALRLFLDRGYATTTMAAIAAEAGVSLKTVYLGFETKSGVVRALWDVALRGERDIAVANQPWYQAVLAETDPVRKLRLNARNACAAKSRIGDLFDIIRTSAQTDPDLAALWALIQTDFRANQQVIIEQLNAAGALREDLDVQRATDLLWMLNHPDVWRLLVTVRGWTAQEWEVWFADACCAQLLRCEPPHGEPPAGSPGRTCEAGGRGPAAEGDA